MVLYFNEPSTDHVYRIAMKTDVDAENSKSNEAPAYVPVKKERAPKTGCFIWKLPCDSQKIRKKLLRAVSTHPNLRCVSGEDLADAPIQVVLEGEELEIAAISAHAYALEANQGLSQASRPNAYPLLTALLHLGNIDSAESIGDFAIPEQETPSLYYTDRTISQMLLRNDDGEPYFFACSAMCPEGELGIFNPDEICPHRISARLFFAQFADLSNLMDFIKNWMSPTEQD